MLFFKKEEERMLYDGIMEIADARFDPEADMLKEWRGENGYHSRLVNQYVHSTHAALAYAYELINRGRDADLERAFRILYKVVPMQDRNPAHDTYGLWSYFAEESLEQMAPPDWNWADFCGERLVQVYVESVVSPRFIPWGLFINPFSGIRSGII